MAAGINDKFNKVIDGTTRPTATYLTAQKASAATSCTVNSTTGWDTDTAQHGIMYRVDSQGVKVPGSQIDWKATVSGTTLSNFTVTAGTDDLYEVGSIVELSPTAAWGDDMADGMVQEHTQAGKHNFTEVLDANGNESLKLEATASAVNEVTLKNNSTGNAPEVKATGGDTNINLTLTPKGSGVTKLGGTPYQTDNSGSITSTQGNVTFQTGWIQITGDGTDTIEETVTFPKAFTTVLGVIASPLGTKASSNASAVTDLTVGNAVAASQVGSITTTNCVIQLNRESGTFGATTRYAASWIAWGIV